MVPCSLLAENIFSVFRSPHLPLDTLIKTSSCSWTFLLVYKGLTFSKSIFFQSFSGNHFSPRFMVPCSLLAVNIFSVFLSPHLPLDTLTFYFILRIFQNLRLAFLLVDLVIFYVIGYLLTGLVPTVRKGSASRDSQL